MCARSRQSADICISTWHEYKIDARFRSGTKGFRCLLYIVHCTLVEQKMNFNSTIIMWYNLLFHSHSAPKMIPMARNMKNIMTVSIANMWNVNCGIVGNKWIHCSNNFMILNNIEIVKMQKKTNITTEHKSNRCSVVRCAATVWILNIQYSIFNKEALCCVVWAFCYILVNNASNIDIG